MWPLPAYHAVQDDSPHLLVCVPGCWSIHLHAVQFECRYGDATMVHAVCLTSLGISTLIWIGRTVVMEFMGVGATGPLAKSSCV